MVKDIEKEFSNIIEAYENLEDPVDAMVNIVKDILKSKTLREQTFRVTIWESDESGEVFYLVKGKEIVETVQDNKDKFKEPMFNIELSFLN